MTENYIGMSKDVISFCAEHEQEIIKTEIIYGEKKKWIFQTQNGKFEFEHTYEEVIK